MKRIILLAVLIAFSAAPAQAVNLQGKYLQSCSLANTGQIDPLVSPGGIADHPHSEFGAKTFTSTSTTSDFLSGGTTCIIPGNTAAYWTSDMQQANGALVHATYASGYYGAFGADPALIAGGKVEPFPQGLRFLVGNSKSATLQSTSIVRWRCDVANGATLSAPPKTCAAGVGVELMFVSPPCWDGVSLDSANHRDHMAYGATGGGCPATHPVRVPQLLWSFHFPAAAVGTCPASDHGIAPCGRSAHMDLWEAQDAFSQALLTQCVNDPTRNTQGGSPDPTLCGTFTYLGGAGGVAPNPWLANLNAWTAKLDYIACAPVSATCNNSHAATRTAS